MKRQIYPILAIVIFSLISTTHAMENVSNVPWNDMPSDLVRETWGEYNWQKDKPRKWSVPYKTITRKCNIWHYWQTAAKWHHVGYAENLIAIYGSNMPSLMDQFSELLDDARQTPLNMAISNRSQEMIQLLVENGTDINLHNPNWDCAQMQAGVPLIHAVIMNDIEIIKFLMSKGAHVNIQSAAGRSALVCAALMQFEPTTKLLINSGAKAHAAIKYLTEQEKQNHEATMAGILGNAKKIIQKNAKPHEFAMYKVFKNLPSDVKNAIKEHLQS